MTPEEIERQRLYNKYMAEIPMFKDANLAEKFGQTLNAEHLQMRGQYDKAIGEAAYLSWNNHDYPQMRTPESLQVKKPTPQEAKERGLLGSFLDGASDAAVGLYAGVGYGIDELAVSASKALNLFGTPEYEARAISKYMDSLERRGVAGKTARSIGQFMIGWLPWTRGIGLLSKGLQATGLTRKAGQALSKSKITSNMMASTMAGGTAFSPHHENLGNDLVNMDNALGGAIGEFWATDPNDPEGLNRLRNALQEGFFSGFADLAILPAAKAIAGKIPSMTEKLATLLEVQRGKTAVEAGKRWKTGRRGKKILDISDDGVHSVVDDPNHILAREREKVLKFIVPKEVLNLQVTRGGPKATLEALESNPDLAKKFIEATDFEEKVWLAEDIAEQVNKNLKSAERTTHENVRSGGSLTVIGPRTAEIGKREGAMYIDAGLDVDTIRFLPKNLGLNDAQVHAFGLLARSSHYENLAAMKFLKSLKSGDPRYQEAIRNFVRTTINKVDAFSFLKEAGTTTSRSMHAFKAVKKDLLNKTISQDLFPKSEWVHALRTGQYGSTDIDRMASMLLQSYEQRGAQAMGNAMVEGMGEGSNWNKFIEAWINQGLLSNPATHALNVATGVGNLVSHVGSQFTAAAISKIPFMASKASDKVLFREAFGSMYGLIQGLSRSFRLSLRAGITNEQLITKGAKIENYSAKHWAAKHFGEGIGGAEGTAIGLGLDFMGTLNRLPGRFLLLEDEFVKSISYEMQLHSKAWKYAFKNSRGWTPSNQLYKDIIDNPKMFQDRLGGFHEQGKDFANLMTFQQNTGDIVSRITGITQMHPSIKLMVPFVKVLTNIPKLMVRHSPMGFIGNQSFKNGGSERMLEMGRMAYGSMLMFWGAHMYNQGTMTGTGSRKYWERKNREEIGIDQEISVKIRPFAVGNSDEYWMDISRFAPYSNLLAMGADVASIMDAHPDDPEMWTDLVWQGASSVQKHLISGTWAPNFHKLLGVVADDRMEGRDWARAVKSIVGTMQPSILRAYEKVKDPEAPELKTYKMTAGSSTEAMPMDWSGVVAKLLAVSPSHSDLVPKRRNIMGSTVKHDKGPDTGLPGFLTNPMISFLSFKKVETDDTLRHIFGAGEDKEVDMKGNIVKRGQLQLDLSPPSDIVNVGVGGHSVRMNPYEYDEFTKLIPSIKNNRGRTLLEEWRRARKSEFYIKAPASADGRMNDRREIMTNIYNSFKTLARNQVVHKYDLFGRAMKARDLYSAKLEGNK